MDARMVFDRQATRQKMALIVATSFAIFLSACQESSVDSLNTKQFVETMNSMRDFDDEKIKSKSINSGALKERCDAIERRDKFNNKSLKEVRQDILDNARRKCDLFRTTLGLK